VGTSFPSSGTGNVLGVIACEGRISVLLLQSDWLRGVKGVVKVEEFESGGIEKSEVSDIGRARPVGMVRTDAAGNGRVSTTSVKGIGVDGIEAVDAIGVERAGADIIGWARKPSAKTQASSCLL
jgi:hypothetical protein